MIQRCIAEQPTPPKPYVSGRGDTAEESQNEEWYRVSEKINLCLSGYTQVLPSEKYDVLGISPARSFDQVAQNLHCVVASAQTGAFGGYPELRAMQISCFGRIDGSELWYAPRLEISDRYKRFIAFNPDFEVCGPEMIVKDGETYRALVAKYGAPDNPNTGESIAGLDFTRGKSSMSVGTERVEPFEGNTGMPHQFSCSYTLHFRFDYPQRSDAFLELLKAMDRAQSEHVKAKF